MRNYTRKAYNAYLTRIAELNGVESATESFSVDPTIQQKVVQALGISSDFMTKINVIPVVDQEGEKLGLGATRPIASRTNTSAVDANGYPRKRIPTDPTDNKRLNKYRCEKTNSDTALKYAKMDAWAHKPNFQQIVSNAIIAQKARDVIMIGFNGTHVAAQTDLATYPMLQDVNIGWLEQIRQNAPEQVLSFGEEDPQEKDGDGVVTHAGTIKVGAGGDYVNLDALVTDALNNLDEWYQDATDLVVITGRKLLNDKYFRIINQAGDQATEQLARDIIMGSRQIGGLPPVRVPYFPATSLLITSLNNLSTYVQEGSQRRFLKDEPESDQVANYESENDAFVVEDYGKAVLIENVAMTDA